MKNRISLSCEFITFLYAYLRLIDLSLDRSRWTSWDDLKLYFKSNVSPKSVHSSLTVFLADIEDLEPTRLPIPIKSTLTTRVIDYFRCRIVKKCYLTASEVAHCVDLLKSFQVKLNSHQDSYDNEIEKLRIQIANFYSILLEPRMSRSELTRAMKVEHYFANRNLKLVPIKEFMKNLKELS